MKLVVEHLRALSKGKIKPEDQESGICDELKHKFGGEVAVEVMQYMKDFPDYSGNPMFPVKCPYGGDPKLRFMKSKKLWTMQYGNVRKMMCWFLANRLSEVYGL